RLVRLPVAEPVRRCPRALVAQARSRPAQVPAEGHPTADSDQNCPDSLEGAEVAAEGGDGAPPKGNSDRNPRSPGVRRTPRHRCKKKEANTKERLQRERSERCS